MQTIILSWKKHSRGVISVTGELISKSNNWERLMISDTAERCTVKGILPGGGVLDEFLEALYLSGLNNCVTKPIDSSIGYKDGAWHLDIHIQESAQFIFRKALEEGALQKWRSYFK